MENQTLVQRAARLRLLCRCLAVTKPEESRKWMRKARFFDAYMRRVERDLEPAY